MVYIIVVKRLEHKYCLHYHFTCSIENITIVSESIVENPNVSNPRRAQELGLSYDTLWCISHLDLHLHPYNVQLTQQLKPADHL